jgi:hypothetical protein
MSPELVLTVEGESFEAGDAVRGRVRIAEGGESRGLHAELRFCEHSNGYHRVAYMVAPPEPLHRGDLPTGADIDFVLGLPADAPPDFAGPHGQLYWEVHVRSDEFGPDTRVSQVISVRRREG